MATAIAPPNEPAILHGIVHDRIRDLWKNRQFYRKRGWDDWATDADIELRLLLKLARRARRQAEAETIWRLVGAPRTLAEAVPWEPAVKAGASYHDLQAR